MKITLPELPEGADSWQVFTTTPVIETPMDMRPLRTRMIYGLLREVREYADQLETWAYRQMQKYRPPVAEITGYNYHPIVDTNERHIEV